MEIFSEIYGYYYALISELLEKDDFTDKDIQKVKQKYSIDDTGFFLDKRFYNTLDTNDRWNLLSYDKSKKEFSSNLDNKPISLPITTLEKSWIKALLQDDKFKLFLSDPILEKLNLELKDVEPLFSIENFYYFDQSKSGDDFKNPKYKENFKTILKAINEHKIIHINEYVSSKGQIIYGDFQPINLEYSSKDDMFRLFSGKIFKNGHFAYTILNLSGIVGNVTITDIAWNSNIKLMDKNSQNLNTFFNNRRCSEPIKVKVCNQRRSIERFMIEFSCYEKRAEYNSDTDTATVEIWYNSQDETELLIRLLSFGKYLEILSPLNIRNQAKERIKTQYSLLFNNNLND